ncbi:riboflavin synthase domain-like protein [Fistulina hepatica ATCC 64428]|uniref:Riboflavin synthase domain-like protein n=1 Tax=Fistulina hepatica ATCC 64428 TaxID=1128425 RepID=A0A0D7A4C9_9AGAR|nr:riboflavin synthase domain-like protein [Fistulina hepatica ATCC 64428]
MTQSLLRSLTFSSRTARRTFVATVATSAVLYYFFYPDKSRSAPTAADARLSPTRFTPLRIVSADHVGPDSLLLTVHVPPHQRPDPIWSVFIKDDAIQVERPFTPLESIDADGNMSFWIKRYRGGEVSRWLHTKTAGEHLEMRGPLQTWLWDPKEYEHVYMISGGTGITPFYQLFCSVITHTAKDALPESQFSTPSAIQVPITPSATQTPTTALAPRFTLLHSSRRIEEFPPEKILRPLLSFADAHPERLRVHLFVDEAPESAISRPYGRNFSQGRVAGILGELQDETATSVWKL